MSDTEFPQRSLFTKVIEEEPVPQEPVPEETAEEPESEDQTYSEDQETILDLLDERDRLREKIDELEESNMWKLIAMLAMSTLYTCIIIAVVDVKNNPEL